MSNRYNYKYLLIIVAIYISCFPLIQIGLHKPVTIGIFHFTAGAIIFPITFILTDITAEVYGYQVARQIVWAHLPATLFYISMLYFELHISSQKNWLHQADY